MGGMLTFSALTSLADRTLLSTVFAAAYFVPSHQRRDRSREQPDPDEVALKAAHVVLGGKFFSGSIEDARLLVVGATPLLLLGGSSAGVTPGKNSDDGGQRQQAGGTGQHPCGGQHAGILLAVGCVRLFAAPVPLARTRVLGQVACGPGSSAWVLLTRADVLDVPSDLRLRRRQFSLLAADLVAMCPDGSEWLM